MKKLVLTLAVGLMAFTAAHAQQTVIVQRPGIITDIATATGTILSLPFAFAEGVVVGTAEAAGSLIHGSTEIVVTPSVVAVPIPSVAVPTTAVTLPLAVRPSTTIITTNGDGTITTVTRQASAYELGPVIIAPVDPNHRVGASPHVNPYIYRPR